MLIIFNWITIQSIILHSILFNYGSVHICENSNKLGRVTSQSKVENKMVSYRTAAMIFTAILDLEARRKAKEALKARRKIPRLKQQQRMRQFSPSAIPWLILSHTSFLLCMVFNSCCTASSLHKAIKSLVSSTTTYPPFCSITHCNKPKGVVWSNCDPVIIRDCN